MIEDEICRGRVRVRYISFMLSCLREYMSEVSNALGHAHGDSLCEFTESSDEC